MRKPPKPYVTLDPQEAPLRKATFVVHWGVVTAKQLDLLSTLGPSVVRGGTMLQWAVEDASDRRKLFVLAAFLPDSKKERLRVFIDIFGDATWQDGAVFADWLVEAVNGELEPTPVGPGNKIAGERSGRASGRTKLAEAEARLAKQWPGLSKHRALSSFPKHALAKGAAVESEHVGGNKPLARRIAEDHLVEDPKYYDKLEKQESKMNKQKGLASGDHRIRPHRRERYTLVAFVGSERDRTYLYFDLANKRSEKPYLLTAHLGSGGTHCTFEEAVEFSRGSGVRLVEHLRDVDSDLAKALGRGHAAGRAKGDPTELNLSTLHREVLAHEARGDKTLHRFSPTSMNAMRRLLAAGYVAPAVGQKGHWVVTGQGEMALEGFRQREAAAAARWAKPGQASGVSEIVSVSGAGNDNITNDPRVECFKKAVSGALEKLVARIGPKGFKLYDVVYGSTLYNQGRGVIAGVPGARVVFEAVGARGARVHFFGSFRYDSGDFLTGVLTVTGAEGKKEWTFTKGKCVEVAKLITSPSTFPKHELKLSSGAAGSPRSGRSGAPRSGMAAGKKRIRVASVQEVYKTLGTLGLHADVELGKKNGESVIRLGLDRRYHAVISPDMVDWVADIYGADHTGESFAEQERHGPELGASALVVAEWIRALKASTERVY